MDKSRKKTHKNSSQDSYVTPSKKNTQEIPEGTLDSNDENFSEQEFIERLLSEKIPEAQPAEKKEATKAIVSIIKEQSFCGPLPPPAILREYDLIVPGSADRIIVGSEEERRHRHAMQKKIVNNACFNSKAGVFFGFIIAMTAIVGGIILISKGNSVTGFASIIAALGGLVSVFIVGKMKEKKTSADTSMEHNEIS